MDLSEQTKEFCAMHNIIPARSRGQNFLIEESIYEKIIEAAELKADDTVLEVGPGLGFLTMMIAPKVKQVVAVELDDKLAEVLRTGLLAKKVENVEVVNEDILQFSIFLATRDLAKPDNFSRYARSGHGYARSLAERGVARQFSNNSQIQNSNNQNKTFNFKIVANLPYNITSIFLRKYLSGDEKPEMMVLMLQKEVAERIVAKPPKMSLLAVSVQFYAQAEIIDYVPAENFWPEPEVDSAIVKIRPHPNPLLSKERENTKIVDKERDFFRMVKFGFSAKRKMLKNNLAAGYKITNEQAQNLLKSAGINEKIRAEGLSLSDWLKLFEKLPRFVL